MRTYHLNLGGEIFTVKLPNHYATASSADVFDAICERAIEEQIDADMPWPNPIPDDEATLGDLLRLQSINTGAHA